MSWAVVWRVLVALYAIYNVGGAPGAAEGWKEFFQPLGFGRVVGVLLLLAIVVSLLPSRWRGEGWQRIRHSLGLSPSVGRDKAAKKKPKRRLKRIEPPSMPAPTPRVDMKKAKQRAILSALDRRNATEALQAIFDEGAALQDQHGLGPAPVEENNIREWNREALAGVKKYAPRYVSYYETPIALGHSAKDMMRRAAEANSPTDLPELKRKLHERLRRLDEIIRELKKN